MIIRIINYLRWISKEYLASKNTEDIYDEIALNNVYDSVVDYKTRELFLKEALSHINKSHQNVLDIACGTGAFIESLSDKDSAEIIGIDISKNMLQVAKKRFAKFPNIILKKADFMEISFPKNSFDLITMGFATRFIPKGEERKFAKNISKWLKKDGMFLAVITQHLHEPILRVLAKRIGIPRGFNNNMNYDDSFVQKMKSHVQFEKIIFLKRQLLIFVPHAIYFTKYKKLKSE